MASRSSGGPPRREPRALLETLGLATYAWSAATDAFAWGPGIEGPLGPGAALLAPTRTFAEACAAPTPFSESRDRGAGVPYRVTRTLRASDGSVRCVEDCGRWFADANGLPSRARGTLRRLRAAEADATAPFVAAFRADVASAAAAGRPTTLLLLAPEAPAAAIPVGALRSVMRRGDRLEPGGDGSLALLLNACTPEQAALAAARLLDRVEAAGGRVRIGGACVPDHALDAATLIHRAAEALEAGPGRGPRFHAPSPPRVRTRPSAAPDLALVAALNGRRLALLGQPLVDPASGRPALSEVRLACPEADGTLRPVAPTAGELAPLLDARALECAADHLAAAPEARLCLPVAAATLSAPDWLACLAGHLGARRGIAARLVVAVEERALADDLPAGRARLDAMKALGIGVALDGYGAGHLDGATIAALPFDLLRLESALVPGATRSPDDRLHLRALVGLGHGLGLPVAAGWVEESETAEALAALGCDLVQGSACGPAAPLTVERPTPRRIVGAA